MRTIVWTALVLIFLQACSSNANQPAKTASKEVIPVKLIPVNSDTSIRIIEASGSISTEDEARLSFKVGGIIESILVKEGDKVNKGQLLATIKSTEIAAQVQQVQLAVEKAQRDYQRVYNLYQDSVATLEQLQNAKTGLDIAKQNLNQVYFNQQYSKIYAPSNGFIVKKIANAGELVNPGSQVLWMSASSGNSKWILRVGLPDEDWALIEKGNNATVSIDAFPGKQFKARVSKKALAADPATGNFPVELQVDFGNEQAANGMFGNASIAVTQSSVGFSIPYDALLEANGRKGYVFVSNDRKTVKKVEVIIAGISNQVAYISSGLEGYAYVVSAGSPYLSEQSVITVN